jgi:putative two-component system response regulator
MPDIAISQVLLVGGAASTRPDLHHHLRQSGYEVLTAASMDEAVHFLARWRVACVLADAALDNGRGQGLLAEIVRTRPGLPVVLLAAEPDLRAAVAGLGLGAMDYLAADDPAEDIVAAVGRALERGLTVARERAATRALRDEIGTLTGELREERERGETVALAALEALVCVVEAKDLWLAGHSVRVAQMAASLAAQLGRTDVEIEQARLAGRLHDIGMVGVSDDILAKVGPLSPEEFDAVRAHVTIGSQILSPLPGLGSVASFVRHHHERWDGQGYPDRLSAEATPWGARVIGAAEIYDALTTARPYRKPIAPELAVEQMKSLIGAAIGAAEWRALAAVVGRREALVFLVDEESQSSVGAMASVLHL